MIDNSVISDLCMVYIPNTYSTMSISVSSRREIPMPLNESIWENIFQNVISLGEGKIIVQNIYLYLLLFIRGKQTENLTELSVSNIKEEYLRWQNSAVLDLSLINTGAIENMEKHSRNNDFSWNSLDLPIRKYLQFNLPEITCNTHRDYLRNEYLGSLDSSFWMPKQDL